MIELTLCSAMTVEKERWGMKMETDIKDTSGYAVLGVQFARSRLEDPW